MTLDIQNMDLWHRATQSGPQYSSQVLGSLDPGRLALFQDSILQEDQLAVEQRQIGVKRWSVSNSAHITMRMCYVYLGTSHERQWRRWREMWRE